MVNKELKQVIDDLIETVKEKPERFREEKELFLEILKQKGDLFKLFKKEIRSKWHQFNIKNHDRVISKSYTSFFLLNLHDLYMQYLQSFYGFDSKSIELISTEKISDTDLYMEYKYFISSEDEKIYKEALEGLKDKIYGISYPFGLLFFATSIFGIIIRNQIKKNMFIILEATVLKKKEERNYIHFLILVRDSRDEQFRNYFYKDLYYFLRPFRGVPEKFYEKLLVGRERLYQLALREYPLAKEKLIDLFYYFYKKCTLLQSISPLLDFLNFVCARVEDSVFSKIEVIRKNLLNNLNYTPEEKNAIIRIFNFIDKESTLYSTFQANNLPSEKSQLNLFLLYMKYYFSSGLESLEVGELLFFPTIFKEKLNVINKNRTHATLDSNSIKNINNFMNYFSRLSENEYEGNIIFFKIFHANVFNLNNDLLKAFLTSFNKKVLTLIDRENDELSDVIESNKFTFERIIGDFCRILYVLIEKIFIKTTPDEASNNFIDPRSRYIGRNIALRVLELFFFQSLNISDDLWPDYLISLNRQNILEELKEKVSIPEKYFYNINELTNLMLFHSLQSFIKPKYFEDQLIDDVIVPLNDFLLKIHKSVEDPSNTIEVYEKLLAFFLDGTPNKKMIKRMESACQVMAPFWKIME